jgi:monovalent cation/hydrogen antiporter
VGVRGPHILPARTRLQGYYVWDTLDFVVNAILFVLIGLQLRHIVNGLPAQPAGTLAIYSLAVIAVVVGTRLLSFFTVPYLMFAISGKAHESDRGVGARGRLVAA